MLAASASLAIAPSVFAQRALVEESQQGDPGARAETLRIDPARVAELSSGQKRATFNARDPAFGSSLLSTAQKFLGFDRVSNESDIASFLDMFDLPFKDEKGEFIPYCASGLAYAAALSYQHFWGTGAVSTTTTALRESLPELERYHFYPSPSVRDMYYVALGKRRWKDGGVDKLPAPKPGWVVIYAFSGQPDHCGILESVSGAVLNTIEFNTSNSLTGDQRNDGMVCRRKRPYNALVKGFIATDAAV